MPKFTANDSIYKTNRSYQFDANRNNTDSNSILNLQIKSVASNGGLNYSCTNCIWACLVGGAAACALCVLTCDAKPAELTFNLLQ